MARGYRQGVYDFVIDSSFTPFTMQEMLVPFTAYKEEYEKMDAAYTELSQKASDFEYLSKTLPEDSKARQIYEGYANDLRAQADDLTKNGLGMGNRRALLNMKRRYSGEIGRLVKADEALKQEQTLRRQMSAKDPSMLYAVDNLSIDSYLDNQTPNLYGVSGNELYTKGAAAGQSASKRVISAGDGGKTLGGYYRDYVQKMGYNADTIAKFRQDAAAIPELQQAADDILKANGVTDNLSGENLARARQQVINGMIDGAVYSEVHNPTRDLGVMTAAESAADARAREGLSIQRENMDRQAAAGGLTYNKDTKTFSYDIRKDPRKVGELWKYDIDETTGQIKGYSKAYEEAVNKGLVKGDGKGGSSTKTLKEPLKGDAVVDKNGNFSRVRSDQSAPSWGKKVSFSEAAQLNPAVQDYHPGYEQSYDYYANGNTITIKAKEKSTDAVQQVVDSIVSGVSNTDDDY